MVSVWSTFEESCIKFSKHQYIKKSFYGFLTTKLFIYFLDYGEFYQNSKFKHL